MAKLYAGEVAVRVANEAVQIHGGYGFIKDYPAEKYYRDVKLCTIGEGTSEIQRLVIARSSWKVATVSVFIHGADGIERIEGDLTPGSLGALHHRPTDDSARTASWEGNLKRRGHQCVLAIC